MSAQSLGSPGRDGEAAGSRSRRDLRLSSGGRGRREARRGGACRPRPREDRRRSRLWPRLPTPAAERCPGGRSPRGRAGVRRSLVGGRHEEAVRRDDCGLGALRHTRGRARPPDRRAGADHVVDDEHRTVARRPLTAVASTSRPESRRLRTTAVRGPASARSVRWHAHGPRSGATTTWSVMDDRTCAASNGPR